MRGNVQEIWTLWHGLPARVFSEAPSLREGVGGWVRDVTVLQRQDNREQTLRSASRSAQRSFAYRAIALVLALAASLPARAQDRITLRPTAIASTHELRLADIADIEGPTNLAQTLIIPDLAKELAGADSLTIDLPRVRKALEKDASINWGRLTLAGVPCRVRRAPSTLNADAGSPKASPAGPPSISSGPRVRDHVTDRVATLLNATRDDLRLTFDESQRDLLDAPTQGRTLTVRPLGQSDRLSLAVTIYRGDTIEHSATLRVMPQVRRTAAVTTRRVNKGEPLDADACRAEAQWLAPTITPVAPESLAGVIARARIEPGTIIQSSHLEQPIVIHKGDIVTVDCIAGTIVVRAMARALDSAKDGEVASFSYLESKRPFQARANGPGRAVLIAVPDDASESITATDRTSASKPAAQRPSRGKKP